jgi:hypothetical protein
MAALSLRPTILGGDKLPNDYCMIHDGRSVGRVRLAEERASQGMVWVWNVNPALPIPPWCNGSADSLEAAKAEFKTAWERFYSSLAPNDFASWHRIEDQGECVMAEMNWSRHFEKLHRAAV